MIDFVKWLFTEGTFTWVMVLGFIYSVSVAIFFKKIGNERISQFLNISRLGVVTAGFTLGLAFFILHVNMINYTQVFTSISKSEYAKKAITDWNDNTYTYTKTE